MADHEDYYPGEAPMAHHGSHEDGGTDEISIAGLAGEPTSLAAHKILPSIHHVRFTAAEARASINNIFGSDGKADVDIDLDTHKLINVVDPAADQHADTKKARDAAITTHAGLATVHQDAPALILTHKGDASAHHAKYTDAEARAVHSPISIPPSSFRFRSSLYDFFLSQDVLKNLTSLSMQYFYAPLILPNGVTITKITLYGYRDDVDAALTLILYRSDRQGSSDNMGGAISNWTDGWGSRYDVSINNPVVDNANYSYTLRVVLDPNDSVEDVQLSGVKIEFTG